MCITAQCPDPTETGIWWRDDASWKLYSHESMRAILKALLKGSTSLLLELQKSSAHPQGASYLIDLSKMEQTNKHSGHKRAIKLILPSSSHASTNTAHKKKDAPAAAPLQKFSAAWFRMGSSNCLIVIRPGSIVEWKVDGEVDAVVNPCSSMGGSAHRLTSMTESSLESTLFLGGKPVMRSCNYVNGVVLDDGGRSLRSTPKQAHGSAVAMALHQAAGPKLQEALQKSVHFASGEGRCGDAVITPGFELPASRVVHAFSPPKYRKHDEASSIAKLEKTYKSALSLAALNGIRYIAFPAVSCGAGGFPLPLAARVALEAVSGNGDAMLEIHFVLLDQNALLEWVAQASKSFSIA